MTVKPVIETDPEVPVTEEAPVVVPEPTTAEKALTIHPKLTGVFFAGIAARWILGIIEYRTSINFSDQTLNELTVTIALAGGYFAPPTGWTLWRHSG